MIQSSKHSAGSHEFNQSHDDYDFDTDVLALSEPSVRLPVLPSRKQSWNLKPPKEPKRTDSLVDDNSGSTNAVNSTAGSASISAGRMIRRLGRKKRDQLSKEPKIARKVMWDRNVLNPTWLEVFIYVPGRLVYFLRNVGQKLAKGIYRFFPK